MLYDPKWEVKIETAPVESWRLALLAGAQLIRERGLAKWTQLAPDGAVCLHGALSIAVTGRANCNLDEPVYCEASRAVYRLLKSRGATGVCLDGCAQWNNVPERTAYEVIEALEAAANTY